MTTTPTRAAPNSAGLPTNPLTGKPYTSVAAYAGHQAGKHMRDAVGLAVHHLTKGKRRAR